MPVRAARSSLHVLQPSLIRKVSNQAIGRSDVIPLWFGEPDQPTPAFIRQAAKDAIDECQTYYQPNLGLPALREALASYQNSVYGTEFDADNFAVTPSGMTALSVALQCVVSEGDSVVIPSPVWPNLPGSAGILGANVRRVPIRPGVDRWHLDIDELFDACDERTSAMLINSPNNPTGWMLSDAEQRRILDFCRERDIWLLSDEVYNRIVFDSDKAPSFSDKVSDADKFLIINSFSKSWAMTGWRLGWITAPKSLMSTLAMLCEFNFSCIFAPTQMAGLAALRDGEAFVQASTAHYRESLAVVADEFAQFPRVRLPLPHAAFYVFFAVDGVTDSYDFAVRALQEAGVGLAPGAAFGPEGEGWLRLCFAADVDLLRRAIRQMRPLLV